MLFRRIVVRIVETLMQPLCTFVLVAQFVAGSGQDISKRRISSMTPGFAFVSFDTLLDLLVPVSSKPDHEIFTCSDNKERDHLA